MRTKEISESRLNDKTEILAWYNGFLRGDEQAGKNVLTAIRSRSKGNYSGGMTNFEYLDLLERMREKAIIPDCEEIKLGLLNIECKLAVKRFLRSNEVHVDSGTFLEAAIKAFTMAREAGIDIAPFQEMLRGDRDASISKLQGSRRARITEVIDNLLDF